MAKSYLIQQDVQHATYLAILQESSLFLSCKLPNSSMRRYGLILIFYFMIWVQILPMEGQTSRHLVVNGKHLLFGASACFQMSMGISDSYMTVELMAY